MQHEFRVDGEVVEVTVAKQGDDWVLAGNVANILSDGRIKVQMPDGTIHFAHSSKVEDTWWVHLSGHILCIERIEPGATQDLGDASLSAPMPGKILQVLVKEGQNVEPGQPLMILEAMKMEHRIVASEEGIISSIFFSEGDQVQQGIPLLEMR
tara:strand:- start:213 stop:671 length:459 start_codon:yes stop_codon:yes gene_type:complete